MELKPCPGCGRMMLTQKIANLTVRCEPTPLDGQGVAQELGAGRQLWTPEFGPGLIPRRLKAARPGDGKLLREHRCPVNAQEALSRPRTTQGGETVPPKAPRPPVARSRPSSGPLTVHSGVRGAGSPRSNPTCDRCGKPCADGTYASIEVGQLPVWAEHVNRKDCRP